MLITRIKKSIQNDPPVVRVVRVIHPQDRSHVSLLQLQCFWHAGPYVGKGHRSVQLGPMYPGIHSSLQNMKWDALWDIHVDHVARTRKTDNYIINTYINDTYSRIWWSLNSNNNLYNTLWCSLINNKKIVIFHFLKKLSDIGQQNHRQTVKYEIKIKKVVLLITHFSRYNNHPECWE